MAPRPVSGPGRRLRRLYFEQALGWALAWVLGLGILFAVAVTTHGRLMQQDLDGELSLLATAVYGLVWMDEDGTFHDEVLRAEFDLLHGPFDLWIVAPGGEAAILLAPPKIRFPMDSLGSLVEEVLAFEDEILVEGQDREGRPVRIYGIPTYDEADRAYAAILAVGDPTPWRTAQRRFLGETGLMALALALVGLLVGGVLSHRALQPVLTSLEQQKSFLAAAAHELRTPVASLRAVCEAPRDDEAAEQTLERVSGIAQRTGALVDQLLLLARLDASEPADSPQPVRLDLLVEATLPEDGSVSFDGDTSVVLAEPALLETACRNLVENALRHGKREGEPAAISISVRGPQVVVEDRGPGFSEALLGEALEPFVARPDSPGTGLGLAIVRSIADRHGGSLRLENRPEGGARVTLTLGESA